jgi:hypothetical protein
MTQHTIEIEATRRVSPTCVESVGHIACTVPALLGLSGSLQTFKHAGQGSVNRVPCGYATTQAALGTDTELLG